MQLSCILYICRCMSFKLNWDALGITASAACAIHCAILPLISTGFSVLGTDIVHNRLFEYSMIVFAFVIGVYALGHGYRKHHGKRTSLVIFSAGILLLLAKQVWHSLELWFLLPAVICIITAHYVNYRMLRSSGCNSRYRSA